MKCMAWGGMLAIAFAVAIVGCGGDEESDPLSKGERCVNAEQSVKACVEAFCKKGTAPAFCDCYAQGGKDLGDGCGCTFATFWDFRREHHCDDAPTSTGHVSCGSLRLEEKYGGKCSPN